MKIIICDKHKEDVNKYIKLIENIARDTLIDTQILPYENISSLLFQLEEIASQIDLIFLENDFKDQLQGKDAVLKIRDLGCKAEVIFLTNSIEKWPDGYDVGAFHYLLKKDSSTRFNEVFKRVKEKIDQKDKKVMSFSYAGDKVIVEISKIEHFESEGRIITLYYDRNKQFSFYSRMTKLENTLLPEGFLRIHRSYLVNSTEVIDYKNGIVMMKNGISLPVGRNMQGIVKTLVKG